MSTQLIGEHSRARRGLKIAELAYHSAHMSEGNIDTLFRIFPGEQVPFSSHNELHAAIDSLTVRGVPWQFFSIKYKGPDSNDGNMSQPKWMSDAHEISYRDPRLIIHEMLANPDFKDDMDFAPYRVFGKDGSRTYQHMMGGDWAWEQAVSVLTSPSYGPNILDHAFKYRTQLLRIQRRMGRCSFLSF